MRGKGFSESFAIREAFSIVFLAMASVSVGYSVPKTRSTYIVLVLNLGHLVRSNCCHTGLFQDSLICCCYCGYQ